MRAVVPVVVLAISVAALTGCSTGGLPGSAAGAGGGGSSSGGGTGGSGGSGGSGQSGSGATSANQCSIAGTALAKFVTAPLSQPYQEGDACHFGVGPNAGVSGAALAQLYGDAVVVKFDSPDTDSNYQAATVAYGGSQALGGVGTEAQYYDGGNGDPQVFAKSANAFCLVQTSFNDATEVGLTKPAAGRNIAQSDVPGLAAKIGAVCSALFGG